MRISAIVKFAYMDQRKSMMLKRTFNLGAKVMVEMDRLPITSQSLSIIINQVSRAASSVGANYRAACRAKSSRDFLNKLKYVEEESDEVVFWIEYLEVVHPSKMNQTLYELKDEAEQILKMIVSSIGTVRQSINLGKSTK